MFTVPKLTTREITTLGLLVALEIVLARFCSIQAWNFRIGFSFLPIAMAAIGFGPIPAAIAASAADVLGAVLFPTTGAYFGSGPSQSTGPRAAAEYRLAFNYV